MSDGLSELRERLERHAEIPRRETAIEGLTLFRVVTPRPGVETLYRPSLCVVAGGHKEVILGDRIYAIAPGQAMVVTVAVPVTGCVVAASPDEPYLGLSLELDPTVVAELALDLPPAPEPPDPTAVAVGTLEADVLDPLGRLVGLLDDPAAAPALSPLVLRELTYRLLTGEHRALVRRIAASGTHLATIAKATAWLREHHREPMAIEDLARRSAMSPTSFHRHFKAVTRLTPLQYRTRIRLQEARRLMLTDDLDATSVALAVGYESPSQFSREYRRMFGAPPAADATRLRGDGGGGDSETPLDGPLAAAV